MTRPSASTADTPARSATQTETTDTPRQSVFFFGGGKAEGTKDMKLELGGKGANLAELTNLGAPVPAGSTIACRACIDYLRDRTIPPALKEEVAKALVRLEK